MNEGQTQCPTCGAKLPTGQQYCTSCGQRIGVPPPSELITTQPTGSYHTAHAAQQGVSSKVVGCVVVAVIGGFILIVAVLVATALPNFIKIREKAKEAEVKQNLHAIQLALERYAVDCSEGYPPFLTGGGCCYSEVTGNNGAAFGASQFAEMAGPVDVLKLESYMPSYPGNPFMRGASRDIPQVHEFQLNLPASHYGNDPLRNGTPESRLMGTRFGADCTKMGNVLGDPRWGMINGEHTWADVDFGAWDIWETNKPNPFLPGEFFYKGLRRIVVIDGSQVKDYLGEPLPPTGWYMLGAYGGPRSKGSDVFGEEQPITQGEEEQWLMTRSEVSDDPSDRSGCPYVPIQMKRFQPENGNPNGICDAVVLVLVGDQHIVVDSNY